MRLRSALIALALVASSTDARGVDTPFVLTFELGEPTSEEPETDNAEEMSRLASLGSPASDPARSCQFADALAKASARQDLASTLVISVAYAETRCRHDGQRSPKGAIGLMQLMPATARRFGADNPWDLDQNIAAGTAYLAWLDRRYGGDLPRMLAAYNAGENAVDRYNGVPPFAETRAYVAGILARLGTNESGPVLARARVEPPFVMEIDDTLAPPLD